MGNALAVRPTLTGRGTRGLMRGAVLAALAVVLLSLYGAVVGGGGNVGDASSIGVFQGAV